jgi:hypothetical protein
MITSFKVNFSEKKQCYVAKIQCSGKHLSKRNYHFDNISCDSMVHELNLCIVFVITIKENLKESLDIDKFFEDSFTAFNEANTVKVSQSLRFW